MGRKKQTKRQHDVGLVEIKKIIGHRTDGKPIRKSFYGKTKREAESKFEEYMQGLHVNSVKIDNDILFSEWCRRWLEVYVDGTEIENYTYRFTYLNTINLHLIPYFGDYKVSEIRSAYIQEFFKQKRNMSFSCIHKCDFILRSILEQAVDNDIIAKTPFRNIKIPSGRTPAPKKAYTKDQERIHLDFCMGHQYGLIAALPLKTSCSRSEGAALMWSDFDIENRLLRISKRMGRDYTIGPCKNRYRYRSVPYDAEFAALLEIFRTKNLYVFCDQNGKPLGPERLALRYEKFRKDLCAAYPDMPKLSYHELRHTYATLAHEDNIQDSVIAALMGHEPSAKITNEVYIHQTENYLKKIVDSRSGESGAENAQR